MHQDLTTVGKESGDSQRHSQDLTTVREKRVGIVTETFKKNFTTVREKRVGIVTETLTRFDNCQGKESGESHRDLHNCGKGVGRVTETFITVGKELG